MQSHLECERLRYSDIDIFPLVSSSSQVEIILCQTFCHTPVTLEALRVAPVELVAYQLAVISCTLLRENMRLDTQSLTKALFANTDCALSTKELGCLLTFDNEEIQLHASRALCGEFLAPSTLLEAIEYEQRSILLLFLEEQLSLVIRQWATSSQSLTLLDSLMNTYRTVCEHIWLIFCSLTEENPHKEKFKDAIAERIKHASEWIAPPLDEETIKNLQAALQLLQKPETICSADVMNGMSFLLKETSTSKDTRIALLSFQLAQIFFKRQEWKRSLMYSNAIQHLHLPKPVRDRSIKLQADTYLALAQNDKNSKRYPEAQHHLEQAKQLADQLNDPDFSARVCLFLENCCFRRHELTFFKLSGSISLYNKIPDEFVFDINFMNQALRYCEEGLSYTKASPNTIHSLEIARAALMLECQRAGTIFLDQGHSIATQQRDHQKAIPVYQAGLQLAQKTDELIGTLSRQLRPV